MTVYVIKMTTSVLLVLDGLLEEGRREKDNKGFNLLWYSTDSSLGLSFHSVYVSVTNSFPYSNATNPSAAGHAARNNAFRPGSCRSSLRNST